MSGVDISNNIQLQQQIQVITSQYVQRRLVDFNELACDTCYTQCVETPQESISYTDKSCINACHNKFLATRRIITKQIIETMNINNKK